MNLDGKVDKADVLALIDYLLGKSGSVKEEYADVNKDNKVDVADVTALIQILLK